MIKKFYGRGNIFVKAKSTTNINGKIYKEGDIITFFDDVQIALGHKVTVAEGANRALQVVDVQSEPLNLLLNNVKNNKQLDKIFYTEGVDVTTETIKVESITNPDMLLYLKEDESLFKVKVFSDGEEVPSIFDKDDFTVQLSEKYSKIEILLFKTKKGVKRTLEKPEFGYFNIVGVVDGILGEKEGTYILDIPSASLISDPGFDISENPEYHTSIAFLVVDSPRSKVTITYV